MTPMAQRFQRRERLYRVHTVSALVVAAWLFVLAITGVAINHQEALGLSEWQVNDSILPDYYRAEYRTGSTPALIILTDIHSGRIFGSFGYLLTDAIALLIILSVATGIASYRLRRSMLEQTRAGLATPED